MVKSLEEIQQENRKLILEAIYGTWEKVRYNENLPLEVRGNLSFLPITLSRVLWALNPSKYGFLNGEIVHFGKENNIWAGFGYNIICAWNLSQETLEAQSEKTQREINEMIKQK
jgi:hypothetical protein